jgi:siroheme synthase
VTHRDYVSSVTIVTGHESNGHGSTPIDWEALAKTGGTLVILMGVKGLAHITHSLIAGGLEQNVPAAVIQEGTTPQQRLVTGTLATIAQRAIEAKITSPAITVIGTVVSLSDALAWYEMAERGVGVDVSASVAPKLC